MLWTATSVFHLYSLTAVAISFFSINYIGYLLNRYYTFQSRNPRGRTELARYFLIMALSLGLNMALMYLLMERLKLGILSASIITAASMMIINYGTHKVWTFSSSS